MKSGTDYGGKTTGTGLNFNNPDGSVSGGVGGGETGHGMKDAILGNAYFRVFEYSGSLYAFSNYGPIWKSPSLSDPWQTSDARADAWEEGPTEGNPIYADLNSMYDPSGLRNKAGNANPRVGAPRHFAVRKYPNEDTLEVWYTSRGDKPERIFKTWIDLSASDWQNWDSAITSSDTVHDEMLRPEFDWEGVNIPPATSKNGSQTNANQLRDPYLFQDANGKWYLFYSGEGEEAIGIASVEQIQSRCQSSWVLYK